MSSSVRCLALAAGGSLLGLPAYADLLSDSHAKLSMRNFYFNSDNRDGTAKPSKTEDWAQGFLLDFRSGYTDGLIGFGVDATAMMGITLDSGRGRHNGSSMIPSDGERAAHQWGSAGVTAKMRLSQSELRVGQLMPKVPVLVASDGRLLPQTFQGVQLQSRELDNLTFIGGALNRARGRASTDLTGMAVSGGTRESDRFYFAGADYRATDSLLLQYYMGQLQDYYQQHFAGLNHTLSLNDYGSLTTDLRYFRTGSQGANGSASGRRQGYKVGGYTAEGDGEIDSDLWSAAFTYRLRGHALALGYQSVSQGSNFVQLNQGSIDKGAGGSSLYLWTDKMLLSFTRAGERTGFAQYGYDFAELGVPGLQASVMYLKGDNIQTASGVDQSEWERDFSLEYVIQSGTFKGLGIVWRNGEAHSEATRNGDQNRLIINYTLALF
ncbi:OprD family porin [Pseudomonas asplenii]|uniref:OprD family porin n=1 Tax=Pseudomonas asplenii TaxID=53407 RepID=UPI0006B4E34C|nr:OprD family porin [Pseudomonas fuscovaginae]